MFEELNKVKRTVREGINTRELEFRPLADFVGQTVAVDGYFFTTSKFGKQVVVVGNGYNINMPKRAVATFEAVDSNDFMVKGILEGHMKIVDIYPVHTDNGNDTVSYTFKDC